MITEKMQVPVCPHCGKTDTIPDWIDAFAQSNLKIERKCDFCKGSYFLKAEYSEIVFTTFKKEDVTS